MSNMQKTGKLMKPEKCTVFVASSFSKDIQMKLEEGTEFFFSTCFIAFFLF
jgi:hypothetical protein